MKRSQLKRKTPTGRSRMRRNPRSTSYSRRDRDFDRMEWCKTLPCDLGLWPDPTAYTLWPEGSRRLIGYCDGVTEAHHAGVHGVGQKAPDDTVIPLCQHHHQCLTDRRECFAGWPHGSLKTWELAAIEKYQRLYLESKPHDLI